MRNFSVLILTFVALLPALSSQGQQTAVPPVLPAEPRLLFAALPSAEESWKIVESRARNDYNSGWLQVILTRSWEGPAPVTAPTQVPRIRITLTDTGGYPAFNGMFLAQGNPQLTSLGGYPALQPPAEKGAKDLALVSIAGRFLVRIETEHLPRAAKEQWFKKIKVHDLQALAARGGTGEISNPLLMFVIDEVQPKRNRTWKMSWTDDETLRKVNEAGSE